MPEIKRGYRKGDFEAHEEAKLLGGLTWKSWRPVLIGRLASEGLNFPNSEKEEILHDWFVLSTLKKIRKISPAEFTERKQKLFEGKGEIYGDKTMVFALSIISKEPIEFKP